MNKNLVRVSLIALSVMMMIGLTACQKKDTDSSAKPTGTATATVANKAIEDGAKINYVNASELNSELGKVIVIDARDTKEFNNGHIPGAINITWPMLSDMTPKQGEPNWGVVLGKDALAAKISSFGIDGTKDIVVYNDPKGLGEEGRVLWMLRVAGINNSKMLNGGYPAWLELKGETTKDQTVITPANFSITSYDSSRIVTTDYLKANLKNVKLIDTRSPDEFSGKSNHGENYKGAKALGHIPGAIAMQYSELYNVDGTIKTIPEIQTILTKLGVKSSDEIITYCTVGIRSAFTAEVLRMAGYANAKNYNGSFSEWAGGGNPFEK